MIVLERMRERERNEARERREEGKERCDWLGQS